METSQTIGKISESLAKAQGQFKPAPMDSINPHFRSKYASLASIMESIRSVLSANGIAILQGSNVEGDPVRVKVTTILTHVSGEFIKDTLSLKPSRDDPQAIGSAITYARRYSLSSLLSIVSDEDDDGNLATGPNNQPPQVLNLEHAKVQPPADSAKKKITALKPKTVTTDTTKPASPKDPSNRIGRIREIFSLSAKMGQTPEEMKISIGNLLNLGRPIKESAEIPDGKLEEIVEFFKNQITTKEAQRQKEAA